MATIKRKRVSTKAVAGQKRAGSILHNKLFWIISSIVLVLLVAAGVIIGVVVAKNSSSSSDDDTVDYFGETYTYNDTEIKFQKLSYQGVLMHIDSADYGEGTYEKHVFFFAYDMTTFYPDESIDDDKDDDDELLFNQTHKDALNALVLLQYTINQYNAANPNDSVYLYIIDTSCGTNSNLFDSDTFGADYNTEGTFAFGYIAGEDGFQKSYETAKDTTKDIFASDMSTFVTTTAGQVRQFINTYHLVLEVE